METNKQKDRLARGRQGSSLGQNRLGGGRRPRGVAGWVERWPEVGSTSSPDG